RVKPGSDRLSYWAPLPAPAHFMRYADGNLWITLSGMDRMDRVDTRTGSTVTASAGQSPIQSALARGKLFVTSRDDHTVLVLDPTTGAGEKPLLSTPERERALRRRAIVDLRRTGADLRLFARPVTARGQRAVLVVGESLGQRERALDALHALLAVGGPLALL